MRFKLWIGVWVLGITSAFTILSIAQDRSPTSTPVDSDDLRVFPGDLICDHLPSSLDEAGPSWMGITIGESTLDDVEEYLATLNDSYVFIEDDNYDIRFVLHDRTYSESDAPPTVRLCLEENVVQVLAVTYPYPSLTPRLNITNLTAQLGEPDVVTWTNGTTDRVAFWFEHGFAVTISTIPNEQSDQSLEPTFGRVGSEIYFPYQEIGGYDDRWPYNQTRKFNPYLASPETASVDFGLENPFDFENIGATVTAQPTRTTTPTLIPIATETP